MTIEEYGNTLSSTYYEYFSCLKSGIKFKPYNPLIQPSMYKKALEDFMLFGKITRYPEKFIFMWRDYCLHNIILLEAMTDIYGHSSYFPYEEFNDVFFYNQETGTLNKEITCYDKVCSIIEPLEDSTNSTVRWKNGHYLLSDYGLPVLQTMVPELIAANTSTELIQIIDKVLNVVHPRSDLAELFIVGGSENLTLISN